MWSEPGIRLGLMTGVSLFTLGNREHIECGVIVGHRLIKRSIG